MKKFEFSLQKVMEVKETEEKILQRDLYLIQTDLMHAEEEQKQAEKRLQSELDEQKKMNRKRTTSAQYMLHRDYVACLKSECDGSRQKVTTLQGKECKARDKLLKKTQEKKTIEKLRESRLEEYFKEVKKEEQDFLDEIAAQSANHINRENE